MQVIPRIYQKEAVKAALKGLRSKFKRALIVLATGLGKTLTVAFITEEFRPKKTLFLVHSNFILNHAIGEFRLVFDERTKMTTYNGISRKGANEADIVFATWQTMGRNLKKWARNHFDLIIVDEAHHSEADTYRPVIQYFTGPRLAITATPDREDGEDIRDLFGPEVINVTLEEAIARGWLPRIEYHVITDESLDENALQKIAGEIRESKRRFTMAEVNRRIFIKKRDVEVTRIINGYDEKAIVFCNSIVHAERMRKTLTLSATFHSSTDVSQKRTWDKNQATLDSLKNGTVRRVCAVNAFNEGVNVPSVGLVAFCRVTGVLTVFRQQLGRGLRPGKEKLIVLDFVGNLERIQLVLEMMNKISDLHEEYTPKGEIEREGYKRERFEVSGKGFEFTFSDKVVDLMKILDHCEREFYPTWQEAGQAARKIGATGVKTYSLVCANDFSLPRTPSTVYPDFPGWNVFLGKDKKTFYRTWQRASKAAQILGIKSSVEYVKKYRRNNLLPSNPSKLYNNFPGWYKFLGIKTGRRYRDEVYPTSIEASRAAVSYGFRTREQYRKGYRIDKRLPGCPQNFYDDFSCWGSFLGTARTNRNRKIYGTLAEASKATRKLGITEARQYQLLYKKNLLLPGRPDRAYKNFPGWDKFLGKE